MYQYVYPPAGTIPMGFYMIPAIPVDGNLMYEGYRMDDNGGNEADSNSNTKVSSEMPDMKKVRSDTEEIVSMIQQHHPDIIMPLTNCGMSICQARQYLNRVVEMTIMHHMMHQMN